MQGSFAINGKPSAQAMASRAADTSRTGRPTRFHPGHGPLADRVGRRACPPKRGGKELGAVGQMDKPSQRVFSSESRASRGPSCIAGIDARVDCTAQGCPKERPARLGLVGPASRAGRNGITPFVPLGSRDLPVKSTGRLWRRWISMSVDLPDTNGDRFDAGKRPMQQSCVFRKSWHSVNDHAFLASPDRLTGMRNALVFPLNSVLDAISKERSRAMKLPRLALRMTLLTAFLGLAPVSRAEDESGAGAKPRDLGPPLVRQSEGSEATRKICRLARSEEQAGRAGR